MVATDPPAATLRTMLNQAKAVLQVLADSPAGRQYRLPGGSRSAPFATAQRRDAPASDPVPVGLGRSPAGAHRVVHVTTGPIWPGSSTSTTLTEVP